MRTIKILNCKTNVPFKVGTKLSVKLYGYDIEDAFIAAKFNTHTIVYIPNPKVGCWSIPADYGRYIGDYRLNLTDIPAKFRTLNANYRYLDNGDVITVIDNSIDNLILAFLNGKISKQNFLEAFKEKTSPELTRCLLTK